MEKSIWLASWIFVLQILAVLLFIPGDWTNKVIEKESVMMKNQLGPEMYSEIRARADETYSELIIDSGIQQEMYNMWIPTAEQRRKSKGMESFGSGIFKWGESRIKAILDLVYQFITRVFIILVWMPYIIIIILPAIFDGLMSWNIKKTNFDYSSPLLHQYSLRTIKTVCIVSFIVFFMPIAIPQMLIPITLIIISVLIGIAIGNWQKRI